MFEFGQKSLNFSDGLVFISQDFDILVELLVVNVKVSGGIQLFCDGSPDVEAFAIEFRLQQKIICEELG